MRFIAAPLAILLCAPLALGQNTAAAFPTTDATADRTEEVRELRAELARISARLDALEGSGAKAAVSVPPTAAATPAPPSASAAVSAPAQPGSPPPPSSSTASTNSTTSATTDSAGQPQSTPTPAIAGVLPTTLPGGATLNYAFDGYYEYNFNQPPGRVNNLRAYDVLSNTFSINQADVMFDLDPDLSKGRRYGLRIDLQYGQATDTLQGNPANEPRPTIYQNIFQAYGTYVVPLGKGLNVDFGKWASSLGVEGNYTKDQIDYSRSYYFYYLPFYHAGARASYHFNDKFAVNYWIVNGTNQSEPTNGFKDELFGFVLTPTKSVTWTSNYYLGQEHPDAAPATNCTGPVQPGLCLTAINPAPNGKTHIFDNYVTWQATPKFTLIGEGDYVIERLWANAAPGESSAPSHVSGGVGYAQYQLNPKIALGARGEYLSDRGGLFSGTTQALKEATGTYKYKLADGLDTFIEFRRDWSNVPYFTTHNVGSPSDHQTTTAIGLVWWYGGKQGAW